MKRWLMSLVIREMQVKPWDTTSHLTRMAINKKIVSIGEDVEKLQSSYTVGGKCKMAHTASFENCLAVP